MMRMTKTVVAMTAAVVMSFGSTGDTASFLLDTVTSPVIDSLTISWDASWIGGNANATVVIADNGTEVKRMTGAGEFTLSGTVGRHELTYTTYIGGVAQDEVYVATVYKDWKYEVVDGGAVVTETPKYSHAAIIPSEIDGYPVTGVGNLRVDGNGNNGISTVTRMTIGPGRLSFRWKASSEYDRETGAIYDYGYLSIDGVAMGALDESTGALNGYAIGGQTYWMDVTLDVEGAGEHTIVWTYKKDAYQEEELPVEDCIWLDNVIWTPRPPMLAECLGLGGVSDITVKAGGDLPDWHRVVGEETHDGVTGLRSGAITHGQTNWVEMAVTGPGKLTFWWKASSEKTARGQIRDGATFFADGAQVGDMIGGTDLDWAQVSYEAVGDGTHTFRWTYSKSETDTASVGEDCAWLDDVTWTPNGGGVEPTLGSVVFDAQGGKFSNGASTKTVVAKPGNLWGKLPMPSKSGQVFDGWYTAASGGDIVTASSQVPAENVTYYAHWTPRLGLAAASEWGGAFETDTWCGQGTVAHDGRDALRSGIIYDGQSSYLITRVSGPGTLTFWWAVSCEAGGKDALRLLVDGSQIDMISGEVDWTQVAVEIPGAGAHTIKWNYTKNGSVTKGEDFGWIDQIAWTPAPTLPVAAFVANGGTFSDGKTTRYVEAKPGNLWGKLPMPAKSGYVFDGYYTAETGGELVTASCVVPDADVVYYAHWTPRLGLAAASEWSREFTTDSWCGQGAVSHDGRDALRSGIIYDGQSSYILTRVPGPGTLTFWWKVSCEAGGNDALRLLVDGAQVKMISGEVDWTKVEVPITGSGSHVIKWNYTKNGSVTKGEDFGWIDQMSWVGR